MAKLSRSALKAKYNDPSTGLYKTNGTKAINAVRVQTNVTDEADSVLFFDDDVLDEDDMASDSATKVPSQQSVKAYVDAAIAGLDEHYLGAYASEGALTSAHPTASPGDYALVDTGSVDAALYIWDDTDSVWVASGVTTVVPDATDTVKGIMKLYPSTSLGSNTDGAPTQNAVKVYIDAAIVGLGGSVVYTTKTASYTLGSSELSTVEAGSQLEMIMNSASSLTLTIPANAAQAFSIGRRISWLQYGVGQLTIAPDTGVTMRSPNNANKSFGQYSMGYIEKIGTNEWVLGGDITV